MASATSGNVRILLWGYDVFCAFLFHIERLELLWRIRTLPIFRPSPYTYTRLARSYPLALTLPKMLRNYVSRSHVPKSLATLPQSGVRASRLSPIRHFKASTPKHLGPTPKLQEVKYVRFGDSNSSGGNNRWRPFRDGKWDTPSKLLAAAVGAGGLYYVMQ